MATRGREAEGQSGGQQTDELNRALAELREANERLVAAGVQMQELADEAQRARDEAEAATMPKMSFWLPSRVSFGRL